jgi:quinoprotein dehydrogenase-associated probable ABC transporter substrate-binding protein
MTALVIGFFGFALSHGWAQSEPTTWALRVCANRNNMPFSNEKQQGFENRIISLIAQDLHAKLSYLWLNPISGESFQNTLSLERGKCDLVLSVGDGQDPYLTTLAYYQSTFVFVYRAGASFDTQSLSLDDPALRDLSIGVLSASIPHTALLSRESKAKDHLPYEVTIFGSPTPLLDEVAQGRIDMAIVWGPIAGYYVKMHSAKLKIVPVTPQVDASGVSMVYSFAMGLRQGDTDLRDLVNKALADKWGDILKVLKDYNIPVVPLPQPASSVGGE